MKGTPDKPSCGFSNHVIQILKKHSKIKLIYLVFNIKIIFHFIILFFVFFVFTINVLHTHE